MRALVALLLFAAEPAQAQTLSLTQGTNMAAAISPDGKQIALDLQGTLWVMPAAGGAARAITDPGMDARIPAWTPDNRTIVFQAFRDGGWHLWSVRGDGTALTQLTKGAQDDREAVVSPDGKQIAFASDRRGNYDVYVMPTTGGEARAITTSPGNEFAPAWSPDGKQIAFVSDRAGGPGLYVIGNAGGAEKLLTGETGLAAPSWKPDGSGLLYVAQSREASKLRSISAVGGAATDISVGAEDVFPFRASWSSPTSFIYAADGTVKQRTMNGAEAKTIPFTAPVTITRQPYTPRAVNFTDTAAHPVQGYRAPQLSPDGKQIAVSALGDIWLVDIDPVDLGPGKKPKARRLQRDQSGDHDPAWAPDGSQLAYVSDRSGKAEVWVRDLKNGKERQLTNIPEAVAWPAWAPDSKRIAFFKARTLEGLGNMTAAVVNAATGEMNDVGGTLAGPGRPSWSPDGGTLAIATTQASSTRFGGGISKFLLISMKNAPDRYVTPTPERSLAQRGMNGPAWSPDGTMMAYIQDAQLWVVPVEPKGARAGELTGAPRLIVAETAAAPSWSSDSKSLVYVATDRLKRTDLNGNVADLTPNMTWSRNVPRGQTVVWAGRLWDGVADTYRTNVDIVLDGNVIAAIEPHREGRTGVALVNASRDTVIPGMIESHTHVSTMFGSRLGRLLLSFGITSIKEPGADPYDALDRREATNSGVRPSPRVFFSGGLYDGARVTFVSNESVTTPEHLDREMTRAQLLGYDFVKTYERLPNDFEKVFIDRAHAIGIPVTSHALYPAVAYGGDSVEHLRGFSRDGYSPKSTDLGHSYQDVIDLVAKTGMTITPTIVNQGGFAMALLRDPNLMKLPQVAKLYRELERANIVAAAESSRAAMPAIQRTVAASQQAARDIVRAGGRVLAGTDAPGVPYGLSYLVELQLLQEAGLTPLQVLQSATVWPAAALGLSKQLGTVEPGKMADLAIVGGDPLARISDLANIRGTVADGHYYLVDELLRSR